MRIYLRGALLCSSVLLAAGCSIHSVEPRVDESCDTSELPAQLAIQDHYILCNGGVFKDMTLAQVLTVQLPSISESTPVRQRVYRYQLPQNSLRTACIRMQEKRDQVVYLSDGAGLVKVPLYIVSQEKIECPSGASPEDITAADAERLLANPVAPTFE